MAQLREAPAWPWELAKSIYSGLAACISELSEAALI